MDEDVDVYFAQHDIQSVVSDILYELGYHRPAEPGPFLAAYVARRFELPGGGGRGRGSSVGPVDYDAVQLLSGVHHPTAEELAVGQMLLEIRKLRRKYSRFVAEVRPDEEGQAAFLGIPWADFEADYERLLALLGSSVLWAFAQRRLAAGRGIFEAHKALNQELEQEPEPEVRVDNCLQLARALPPGRLLELFRKLHEEPQLKELVKGRTPGCEELTADADAPAPGRNTLKGLFSCISAGGFLKETVLASLRLLERSSKATGGATFAEYRLPLLAEGDAWADLAEWHQELGSISERLAWVVQLPVSGYAALKGRRSILDYGELLSNAFGPPLKLAMEGPKEAQGAKLSELLERVVGFEVSPLARRDRDGCGSEGLRVCAVEIGV
ncbi:unnamed protein product [Effrenium voratum]|uniref:Uncharacterized protein n=1 Tax=Effrenium voratum TaxID=2562239 RepID=A0AA36HZW2_9DINO|nr:unnamed protein product [Effrenium voratum]